MSLLLTSPLAGELPSDRKLAALSEVAVGVGSAREDDAREFGDAGCSLLA